MMFGIYLPVCLRAVIVRFVPEHDKGTSRSDGEMSPLRSKPMLLFAGKAFSLVALVQNLDILLGTVVCIQIYRASVGFFAGFVFLFAFGTRVIALVLIL